MEIKKYINKEQGVILFIDKDYNVISITNTSNINDIFYNNSKYIIFINADNDYNIEEIYYFQKHNNIKGKFTSLPVGLSIDINEYLKYMNLKIKYKNQSYTINEFQIKFKIFNLKKIIDCCNGLINKCYGLNLSWE